MSGSQLTFFKVTRHHTGIYNCSANNGFSSTLPATASKTITLDVHRKLILVILVKQLITYLINAH
jgi:hypothetical protein